MAAPQINPGEITGWPKLKIVYRSDPEGSPICCPPASSPALEPNVHLNIYSVPVQGRARVRGVDEGRRRLRRHHPATTASAWASTRSRRSSSARSSTASRSFRAPSLLPARRASRRPVHPPGLHLPRVRGQSTGAADQKPTTYEETTGGSRSSRAVGGVEKSYDFPPHVVGSGPQRHRAQAEEPRRRPSLLRDSPWDPTPTLLPMREQLSRASLVWSARRAARSPSPGRSTRSRSGRYADTIGGSRWPGSMGGPRFDQH